MSLLRVEDLHVQFWTQRGTVYAVNGVSFEVAAGETLGIVGESGCGKSVTSLAVLGLLPRAGCVTAGTALFDGRELLGRSEGEMRKVRGGEIGMIFQDPMTSLNPVLTIGRQIREALEWHFGSSRKEGQARAVELLEQVGIPEARRRVDDYPHQFSGGMRQRAMIAMALACEPKLLIADEPTTALDVTIQAQILEVLKKAQEETQAATIMITHDLGLVAELADRVVVMYAGKVVELTDVHTMFAAPRHPYTVGLMDSLPRMTVDEDWLRPIPGQPPSMISLPPGCSFHPRCFLSQGRPRCREEEPPLRSLGADNHLSACHFAEELEGQQSKLVAEVAT